MYNIFFLHNTLDPKIFENNIATHTPITTRRYFFIIYKLHTQQRYTPHPYKKVSKKKYGGGGYYAARGLISRDIFGIFLSYINYTLGRNFFVHFNRFLSITPFFTKSITLFSNMTKLFFYLSVITKLLLQNIRVCSHTQEK